jgi:SCY1-like protein 2
VCLQRIIPCLEQEFINPDMIPFVLPNIFLISEIAENEEFNRFILPKLKAVFKLQKPVQVWTRVDWLDDAASSSRLF